MVRKTVVRTFILDHLIPRLEDRDWLLHQDDALLKVRDEILLGLHFKRSESERVLLQVFLRPLYWPAPAPSYGIREPIGRWFPKDKRVGKGWIYLDGPELAEEEAIKLSAVINARVAPFLKELIDGLAILRYQRCHFSGPMLSWNPLVSGPRPNEEILGYIAAWSGQKRQARSLLKGALSERKACERSQADTEFISHLQTTLHLLDQPEQVQAFLKSTADQLETELKLDRARPIAELVASRQQRKGPNTSS
jgi:hypothetical protein